MGWRYLSTNSLLFSTVSLFSTILIWTKSTLPPFKITHMNSYLHRRLCVLHSLLYLFIMIHACSFTVILNSTVCFELQHNTTQQLVYLQTNPVWCLVKHRTSVFTAQCNNLLYHSTRAFYVTVKTWCHRKCTSSWCGIMNTSKTDVTFTMTFTQTTILSTQRYH